MGHVNVRLKVRNPQNMQAVEDTALVDTGATFTVVPRKMAEQLQLKLIGKRRVRTASGFEELDESFAQIEIDGRTTVSPIVVSDSITIEKPLIGVISLEALGLVVDTATGKLKETEALLM